MVTQTIAQEAYAGDSIAVAAAQALRSREQRALKLYEERGHEIEQYGPDLYRVPSADGERTYNVRYGGEHEFCNCADAAWHPQRACKHILAVGIKAAKSRAQRRRAFIAAYFGDADEEVER